MKRILSFILLLSLVLGIFSLNACFMPKSNNEITSSSQDGATTSPSDEPNYSTGLMYKSTNNGRAYAVSGIGTCTDLDIVIPSEHNGKPVTKIADMAFYANKDIKSVKIPEGVTSIGEYAFASCFSLESVELPLSLEEISSYAFNACLSLKSINLHSGITNIEPGAFYLCVSLESFIVPAELENLYIYYMYMNSLKSFEIDGESDFLYTIDGNLYAEFYGGEKYLLAYASGKEESEFTVPSDVFSIASGAFSFYPWDYKRVEGLEGTTILTYDYYSNLKRVTISEGVQQISSNAFMNCNGLSAIVLPKSLTYIGENAFMYCSRLSYVEFDGTIAEWEAVSKADGWFFGCPITQIKCTDGYADPNADSNKETVTVWVPSGMKENFEAQIISFMSSHPEYYSYNVVVEEIDYASEKVLENLDSAADIYCFTNNEIEKLVSANALSLPGISNISVLQNRNCSDSVNAATVNGTLYAYPMATTNGYFMYYDKSIITNPDSLEQIIADVEAYNATNGTDKKIAFNLSNAWINASFFFGAGCHSNWTFDNSKNYFVGFDDNYNSDKGLVALKGMQKLSNSSCFDDSMDNHMLPDDVAVVISGMWGISPLEDRFGENIAVTDLPSFTVDGTEYHLGSFSGHYLLGVKPQDNRKKSNFLHELALYLTNKDCQLERYDYNFNWIPTNRVAQMDEAITSDPYASALITQNQYSTPQREMLGSWWNIASKLGTDTQSAITDDDLRAILEEYENAILQAFEEQAK